jgi:hypothetical protein
MKLGVFNRLPLRSRVMFMRWLGIIHSRSIVDQITFLILEKEANVIGICAALAFNPGKF